MEILQKVELETEQLQTLQLLSLYFQDADGEFKYYRINYQGESSPFLQLTYYDLINTEGPDVTGITTYEQESGNLISVKPRDNSALPIFLFEITYKPGSTLPADKLPMGVSVLNKKANSVYELVSASPNELRQFSFTDKVFKLKSRPNSKTVDAVEFSVFRINWDDYKLDKTIDINNLALLPSNTINNNPVSLNYHSGFIISAHSSLNSGKETVINFDAEFFRDMPPETPEFPDEPIAPTPEFERECQSIGTGQVCFTLPTREYLNNLASYNEEIEDYNFDVQWLNSRYNEDVADWEEAERDFREVFNGFIDGANNFTVLVERKIQRWLISDLTNQKTSNPADIFIYILQTYIARSKIETNINEIVDRASFVEWRAFCETNNLKFSASFDFETTVFDVLKSIAFVGLAEIDYSYGKMRMIIKKPQTLINQHFHSRNLRDFRYTRKSIAVPDVIIGQYLNKSKNYLPDEERIYLNNTNDANARDEEILTLFGVTDTEQVRKYLKLQKNQYEILNEVWSFETDVQGIVARRGDLVGLNHYEVSQSNFTARVRGLIRDERPEGSFIKGIQIDQNSVPELKENQNYQCRILTNGGNEIEFRVDSIEDTGLTSDEDEIADLEGQLLTTRDGKKIKLRPVQLKTLMLETPINEDSLASPIENDNYVLFGIQGSVFRQCLVNSVSIDKSLNVSISLIPYDARLYEL